MHADKRPLVLPSLATLAPALNDFVSIIFAWGWLLVVALLLWVAWKIYMTIKAIDYERQIQWTYLQIGVPDEAMQTPKAMENAFDVWDGIHKNPDLIEKFFEGYMEAWYSCEIYARKGRASYIMVVPTVHRTFFEGVIYGQYPEAIIQEVQDYTLRYSWQDIDEKFDLYGTEIIFTEDDIMPIKTYHDYEDVLAEEERFVDPHQALIEAYTNVDEGQEFWVQILVRPTDPALVKEWELKGEEEVDKLGGKDTTKKLGLLTQFWHGVIGIPGEVLKAAFEGPVEGSGHGDLLDFPRVSDVDKVKSEGIMKKIAQGGYKVRIRVIYLAPMGELHKPNISRAIGGFKQFNTYVMNSLYPDPASKTNGPNYLLKQWRRYLRKRKIFLYFQWRHFGDKDAGIMMSATELATLYHFPSKYLRAPAVERVKAGLGSPPVDLPMA